MSKLRILISGGGIAGPSAAFWLSRLGHSCTIIERFPSLRTGGQQIDIRGQGIEAAKRMGILEEIRNKAVDEDGLQWVDSQGRQKALLERNDSGKGRQSFTSEFEVMRGDLCKIIYEATKQKAQYRFGTSIESFENVGDKVKVRFSDGADESYDLVIAADGQGSRVRRKLFADDPEAVHVRDLNLNGCYYNLPREADDKNLATVYSAPGRRVISTRWHSKDRGQAYLMTMSHVEELKEVMSQDVNAQKRLFAEIFKDAGWQAPRLIKAMHETEDFYAQSIVQIKTKTWSKERVVLLGDAGYAPSPLTGVGTTLALIGACVLSGEIARHGHDVPRALKAYEDTLRPYVEKSQKLPSFIPGIAYPKTNFGIKLQYSIIGLITKLKIDKAILALKFDYYWKQNGHIRHAVSAIQDMSDPMVLRLGKMRNIDDIAVVLRAPRRGYFVGAFMMMFAKMDDVYFYIRNRLPSVPMIIYDKAVRGHGHRGYQLPARNTIPDYMRKEFKETLLNFQKNIAAYAARMLVKEISWEPGWSDNLGAPDQLAWEHINYHTKSIRAKYQFLLDNLVGPVGGCMDMLCLHRSKTMFSSRMNYFSLHEWVAGRDSGGLAGASSKINRRLRALFDPYATEEVLRLRQTCSHLHAVPWATASSRIPLKSRSSSHWLEHYPNGIRYHWNGRSLVERNFRWEAKKYQTRTGRYRGRDWVARLSRC
ncbi:2-polyprenyl-6-methoxyphenol hydroxylase [Fusarium mexicanum]|uniref:2-polyprenyl-6-methoxyphenol hydroxylase n=1 Tax=Fusarium mexicanum TaxID=751941 RepID=A0A8H5N7Q3_9HYPO|nr:2-polyprenyl-6-methoxyphenol hydroxylase [Fusarium mexicanum]